MTSLTSHNGIESFALYSENLGDPYGVRINDNPPGANSPNNDDFLGVLVLDGPQDNGLAVIYLPHADNSGFLDLWVPGTFENPTANIELVVTTDPNYVPNVFAAKVIPEPTSLALLGLGMGMIGLLIVRRRRQQG